MNEKYVVIGNSGEITHSGDTFAECLRYVLDGMKESDFEFSFDHGVMVIRISKVRKRPFKILREVEVVIHDEIKRKECETNASTEDHSCDDLFKEW